MMIFGYYYRQLLLLLYHHWVFILSSCFLKLIFFLYQRIILYSKITVAKYKWSIYIESSWIIRISSNYTMGMREDKNIGTWKYRCQIIIISSTSMLLLILLLSYDSEQKKNCDFFIFTNGSLFLVKKKRFYANHSITNTHTHTHNRLCLDIK